VIRSRNTFTCRFRVTDARGYVVCDALVYTVGLPYYYVRSAPATPTGTDGYAVINITPTARIQTLRQSSRRAHPDGGSGPIHSVSAETNRYCMVSSGRLNDRLRDDPSSRSGWYGFSPT
jgi:hypothetical protein